MEVPEARPRTTSPLAPPSSSAHGLLKLPDDPSEVTEVNPWALATSPSSLFSYHTHVGTTPLFATPPKWSQINQQQLGNCWFLAAISSILLLPDVSGHAARHRMRRATRWPSAGGRAATGHAGWRCRRP
jgi:hypothetical protein